MAKTLTYFTSGPCPHHLTVSYGQQLEGLSFSEKAHLLSILSAQLMQIADGEPDYSPVDSYADHAFLDGNGRVIDACEILEPAPTDQIKGLILALSQYLYESR